MDHAHSPPRDAPGGWRDELAFLRRTLIVAGVVLLLLFLWVIRDALLLAFAAILVAVLIRMVADPLRARVGLKDPWPVVAACAVIGLPLMLALLLVGNEIREQAGVLLQSLPGAADTVERVLGVRIPVPGTNSGAAGGAGTDVSTVGEVARHAASAALIAVDALSALAIVAVGGIYFAVDPDLYRRGVARLMPRSEQRRVEDALESSGRALCQWLKGQLIAMAVVGLLTGLGAWAIGLPAPLALGLFAGLTNIVPLVGPFIGAIPGVLVAVNEGWTMLIWALLLYLAVQQIEGNLLVPLLGERMASIPPALLLFAVVAGGALFGLGGVILAAPLTVVAVVVIGKFYVRDTLGKDIEVPGDKVA